MNTPHEVNMFLSALCLYVTMLSIRYVLVTDVHCCAKMLDLLVLLCFILFGKHVLNCVVYCVVYCDCLVIDSIGETNDA